MGDDDMALLLPEALGLTKQKTKVPAMSDPRVEAAKAQIAKDEHYASGMTKEEYADWLAPRVVAAVDAVSSQYEQVGFIGDDGEMVGLNALTVVDMRADVVLRTANAHWRPLFTERRIEDGADLETTD